MAIIARASSGSGDHFEPAPTGMHRAICCDVQDLGVLETQWGKKHKVQLVWQTEQVMPDGKPYLVGKRYSLSLDERSVLRKDLEAWRGKPFTLEQAAGFDLEVLIGHECGLLVMHKNGNTPGKVWANVQTVLPKLPGAPLSVRDYVRKIHRTAPAGAPVTAAAQPIGPSFAPPPSADEWEEQRTDALAMTADSIPF